MSVMRSSVLGVLGATLLCGCGASRETPNHVWGEQGAEVHRAANTPIYAVSIKVIAWAGDDRAVHAKVVRMGENVDDPVDPMYEAYIGGSGTQQHAGSGFVPTNGQAPVLDVQAGYALLWGIWPSGRTVRVVTAAQAAAGGPPPDESQYIIQIMTTPEGEAIHRLINAGPQAVSFSIAQGRVSADDITHVTLQEDEYIDVTEVPKQVGQTEVMAVQFGEVKKVGHDAGDPVEGFRAAVLAKKAGIGGP